jgi:hypothetical protein
MCFLIQIHMCFDMWRTFEIKNDFIVLDNLTLPAHLCDTEGLRIENPSIQLFRPKET